jgi:hypothetical protein
MNFVSGMIFPLFLEDSPRGANSDAEIMLLRYVLRLRDYTQNILPSDFHLSGGGITGVRHCPLRPPSWPRAISILIATVDEERNDGSMEELCGSLPRIADDKYATLEIG